MQLFGVARPEITLKSLRRLPVPLQPLSGNSLRLAKSMYGGCIPIRRAQAHYQNAALSLEKAEEGSYHHSGTMTSTDCQYLLSVAVVGLWCGRSTKVRTAVDGGRTFTCVQGQYSCYKKRALAHQSSSQKHTCKVLMLLPLPGLDRLDSFDMTAVSSFCVLSAIADCHCCA